MGKGFGINSKAQEARERKEALAELKKGEQRRMKEEKEERDWQQGAKTKTTKQISEEQKRAEKLEKKREKEKLLREEEQSLSQLKPLRPLPKEKKIGNSSAVKCPPSPTQSHISAAYSPKFPSSPTLLELGEPSYSASNIDDALFLLSSGSSKAAPLERHPERRVKAAYALYEEREMPLLKLENPGLRLAQLKEKLYKQWLKAPENPFNQAHIRYNATKSQESLASASDIQTSLDRLKMKPNWD